MKRKASTEYVFMIILSIVSTILVVSLYLLASPRPITGNPQRLNDGICEESEIEISVKMATLDCLLINLSWIPDKPEYEDLRKNITQKYLGGNPDNITYVNVSDAVKDPYLVAYIEIGKYYSDYLEKLYEKGVLNMG